MISMGATRRRVWCYRDSQIRDQAGNAIKAAAGELLVTFKVSRSPGFDERSQVAPVDLELPNSRFVAVIAAKWFDLPRGNTVHVSRENVRLYGRRRFLTSWSLVTSEKIAAPVKLKRRRDLADDRARTTFALRTLLELEAGSSMQLARPPAPGRELRYIRLANRISRRRDLPETMRRVLSALGAFVVILRSLDVLTEIVLRLALRSPSIMLRTTQAVIGDDSENVARLHPSVFPLLGITPGRQILVNWCGTEAAVVALEDHTATDAEQEAASRRYQRVERTGEALPKGFPGHLVVHLPSPVRQELTMPASTIVSVRRRLRPLVLTHLNQLALPVAGLAAAVAAIPELRWLPTILASALVLVLGFLNLRVPKQPKGVWP